MYKSLQQQLERYAAQTEEERQRLEQEKADLKRKEDSIRETLQAEYDRKNEELQETIDKKQEELREIRDELAAEKRDWEEEKERVKQTKVFEKVITLNVGGTRYTTTLSTLTRYPDSMLGVMFSGRHDLPQQEDGSYFIDKDGEIFKYIMMYLRDRDYCFCFLHDDELCKSQNLPSPLESSMLKLVAYEAQYFQVRELETKVRIILNPNRGQYQNGAFAFQTHLVFDDDEEYEYDGVQYHRLDYGQSSVQSYQYTEQSGPFTHYILKAISDGQTGTEFRVKVTFDSCDLSGITFRNCYFQQGVSFEGCILRGTKFECVGGLVSHKVHFAPWQVAQADFEPELLQALKDNGCIY